MPQAEAARRVCPQDAHAVLVGFGGGVGAPVSVVRPRTVEELRAAVELAGERTAALPRGMGRSYGDAAQVSGGLVIDTSAVKRVELDAQAGTVTAQAGVTIGELLQAAAPRGWVVPVVPGTQHVSVGGAIASDIHGKNHGTAGTLGAHVEAIAVLRSDGELVEVGPKEPLFQATLGGMGLTGVIVEARIRLRSVPSPTLAVDTDRVGSLDEALAALRAPGGSHRVAWLDLLGPRLARGVVTRADHVGVPGDDGVVGGDGVVRGDRVSGGGRVVRGDRVPGGGCVVRGDGVPGGGRVVVRPRTAVPRGWPAGVLRPATVRVFNALKYAASPRRERGRPVPFGRHMFPLDSLEHWPRLYGPRGFIQYQLAVPTGAERVLELVIEGLRRARVPCYLAVLKDFGPASGAPLSFPIEGWTLALDIPRAASGLGPLLDGFDAAVAEAGGRVYLSKDSRLRPDALRAMYPRLEEWRAIRDRADPGRLWCSDLARRTGLL